MSPTLLSPRATVALLVVAGAVGCRPALGYVPCAKDRDCPRDFACERRSHVCYPADAGVADAAAVLDAGGLDATPLLDASTEDLLAGPDALAGPDGSIVDASTATEAGGPVDASSADAAPADAGTSSPTLAIFRSVGPGQGAALASGTADNQATVTAEHLAVAQDLPLRVGVGDVVIYDSDGDGVRDARAFLVERVDARSFLLQPGLDETLRPTNAATAQWALFRAYTSLAQAVTFDENAGIDAALRDFDPYGSPPDLVARNLGWNLACYADGVDTARVVIQGWGTDAGHWMRLYTPTALEEAGASQRHAGRWTEPGAYVLRQSASTEQLWIANAFVDIDGLQIDLPHATWISAGVSVLGLEEGERVRVQHSIVRGHGVSEGIEYLGIEIWSSDPSAELQVTNNLIYGLDGTAEDRCALCAYEGTLIAINNTLASSAVGLDAVLRDGSNDGRVLAVNNLVTGCSVAARGQFEVGTGHNATDQGSLGYTLPGASEADRVGQQFAFVEASAADFHLAAWDLGAIDYGRAVTAFELDDDLDGQPRSGVWDIGADEWVP